MGREVRRVPENWKHPKKDGRYIPLMDGYNDDILRFNKMCSEKGSEYAIEYFGGQPQKEDYMPVFPESERTHYQMYENVSEGTPISPPMESPEALAMWLFENDASAFANQTASYESWLCTCKSGYAPSFVITANREILDGVTACKKVKND